MYLGGLLTILAFPLWSGSLPPFQILAIGAVFLLPGGIDGTTQLFGDRESNNRLRAITGFVLGVGVVLFLYGVLFLIS
jgi:uncharacterized membrane protein